MKRSRSVPRFLHRLLRHNGRAGERHRLGRQRIEALRHAALSQDAFFDYLSLLAELQDPDLIAELRSTFRHEWSPYMQRELARHLRTGDLATARLRIQDMRWEWQEGVGESAPAAVAALIEHLEHPFHAPSRQTIEEIAYGFQALGLEATGPVVQWLATSAPEDGSAAEILFSTAGASGRYLVRRWAEKDRTVQEWLHEHEAFMMPTLPAPAGRVCAFWPEERSESPVAQQGVQRLALDFNPFGPEKAEHDPMLPDLFFRLWPVWQEVTTPRPSLLVAPPGSGRSALISMVRYESELVGSALDRTCVAYAQLDAPLDAPALAQHLAQAVYLALTCFLARRPDALLGLDDVGQAGLGGFMLQRSGGLEPLIADLGRAGLRVGKPDVRLLHEALERLTSRQEPGATGVAATRNDHALVAVRALLLDAFTDRELLTFCRDRTVLRPALADFGPGFSFGDMVDALVSYALRRGLLETLLAEVSAFNPAQFARHRPFLPSRAALSTGSLGIDSARLPRPYGIDYISLLLDVSFEDEIGLAVVLESLFERWLLSLTPQHIMPKVFVSTCPTECVMTPVPIEWSTTALYDLLCHRLERAGLAGYEGQPLLAGWVDGVRDPGRVLAEAAHGVPQRMIRFGNRIMARLAQPAPLDRDEFFGLVDSQ